MKVLLLGSGGREHALAWRLSTAPSVSQVICAPGNPGMAQVGQIFPADLSSGDAVVQLARRFGTDLVVVGPEAPLVAGVTDALLEEGVAVFGPGASAARIEGSKAFAKEIMMRAGVPTGAARSFSASADAIAYIDELGPPYVVKADGLAAGKGVVVTSDRAEAVDAIEDRLDRAAFGEAGSRVLIEEFLEGEEASLIAFSDGRDVVACEPAQDYKRVGDGDAGPNTGGMGSYSPVPACPPDLVERVLAEVIAPTVSELSRRGTPFVGALYAGLALTAKGPKVIEFNARFGDPETQALMPRLTSDLGEVCMAAARGELAGVKVTWTSKPCVSVVLGSRGYPGPHPVGLEIEGVNRAAALEGVNVFHAGTKTQGGRLITAGGRVLAVSAIADTFAAARARVYEAADMIRFQGKYVRTDIALRAEEAERS